jgi:hypothetical protein
MKVKSIVLAVVSALTATSALAADLTSGVPAGNIYYIGGASAQTPGIAKTLTAFCNAGAMTTYADSTGKNDYAFACSNAKATTTATAANPSGVSTTFAAGAKFLVIKMDEGGSFNGVGPVATASNITASGYNLPTFIDATNCPGTAVTIPSSVLGTTVNGGLCNKDVAQRHPQFGFSDVPKSIWAKRGQLLAADDANLTQVSGFAGQGFGVVVSSALYAALQADQGLASTVQPSISSNQYASIAQAGGALSTVNSAVWDILLPKSAAAAAAGTFVATTAIPAWPPAATLTLARRVTTSGTQAASDVYFLNAPCETGTALGGGKVASAAGTYVDSGNYASTVNFVVKEESGTGGVKTDVASGWTLGVISLENAQSGLTGGAKYVALNGINPVVDALQKQNSVNGTYDFAYETEMVLPKGVAIPFAQALVKDMGDGSNGLIAGLYTDPANAAGALVEGETNHYTRSGNACSKAAWAW